MQPRAEYQRYQELKVPFPIMAKPGAELFNPRRFGQGNGFFIFADTRLRESLDPSLRMYLIFHHQPVSAKFKKKSLMSYLELGRLIKDDRQTVLNSLCKPYGITLLETRHIVVTDGKIVQTFGAYWNEVKKRWCPKNFIYVNNQEIHGLRPHILAFVPPKLKPLSVVKKKVKQKKKK